MRRIARSGCEPGTRPSRSTYENSNPDLSSIPRIIPIRLGSTRGNHANETKERTFFNILLASSIRKMTSPEGTVIALNGPWGSGKSSAVSLVLYHLREAVEANEI